MTKTNIIWTFVLAFIMIVGCEKDNSNHDESYIQTQTMGPITLKLSESGIDKVTFSAKINVDLMADVQEVGFIYSTDDNLKVDNRSASVISIKEEIYEETFIVTVNTKYFYTTYMLRNGIYSYGETQIFTCLPDQYIITATNLSSSASANCYIVSDEGLYKFKAVKGNSETPVGSVASTSVLWETFGTEVSPYYRCLIDGVCYKDGFIAFQTADTFKEGNAVIAAKDANGTILWSWHIWFTDEPQGQVYYNNAGTMMDRNLGATSATPGDVGALGLLYQWGRKDPFLGSSSIRSTGSLAKSTISWPSAVSTSSSVGTLDYVTSHPTTFVCGSTSSEVDWHYSSRDNTLWTTSENAKSIYDPCPAGWRVPDGDSNDIWSKAGFDDTTYDSTKEGISFSISSPSTTWYPASGYRRYDGSFDDVGDGGYCWSTSPIGSYAYGLSFSSDGSVRPSVRSNRANGQSVRCLQESK